MTTTGDGRAPSENGGAGEKPQVNEEHQSENVSLEAGKNNSSGVSDEGGISTSIFAAIGISELEQILKQKTFTRSETQRLTALLHSRTCDDVLVETQRLTAKAYKGSSISIGQALGQDSKMIINNNATSMENLPVELLSNIFIRLLAKQLAQMRCVSKSWNAILSQSSFVKSHLHRSTNNKDQILLFFYNNGYSPDHKPYTARLSQSPHLELTDLIKLPPVNPESGSTTDMIKVIGSVHGLICSCYSDDVIHIWNLSLSSVSTLPPYSLPSFHRYEICFRFGFDPKTEDYKVVMVTGLIGPPSVVQTSDSDDVPTFPYVFKKWLQAQVYSMKKGSWELITQRFPSHITRIFNKDDICVDGHDGRLHWVGHTSENVDSETIVAFDLGSETFLEMSLPESVLDYNRTNSLGVLGGKLCVMSRDGGDGIEVWVMEEYGVAESWVKHHVFCFSHTLGVELTGFTSRNEFLFEDIICRIVLYDPTADKAKILDKNCRGRGKLGVYKIVEYVDSLVWVSPLMR